MFPNPTSQARGAASSTASHLSSRVQGSKIFSSASLYVLGTGAVFALLGLAAVYFSREGSQAIPLALLQIALLLLGWLYAAMLPRWLNWYDPTHRWQGGLIIAGTALLGAAAIWALRWVPWAQHSHWPPASFMVAVIPFLLPYFFWASYQAWRAIPHRQYKLWFYDPLAPSPDTMHINLKQFVVVHFSVTRPYGESEYLHFSSEAPLQMLLGDVFADSLAENNANYPNQQIACVDKNGQPYGWLFYAKQSKWIEFWRGHYYFDPNSNAIDNSLRQGDVIMARRVSPSTEPGVID